MDASQKNSQSAYVLPLICSFGIPAENLSVELGPEFDRLAYPDPGLESSINQTWEARLAQQPSLFNGSKFRVSPSLDNRASKKLPSLQQHPHHCHFEEPFVSILFREIVPRLQDPILQCLGSSNRTALMM